MNTHPIYDAHVWDFEQAKRDQRWAAYDRVIAGYEARLAAMTDDERERSDRKTTAFIRHHERKELHKREDDFVPGFEEDWT